ncbi:MAG TPA: porin [Anaeromyxobacteraceae bacterium]|nr:porin [Anaeromyxobacteraceae bacterium]
MQIEKAAKACIIAAAVTSGVIDGRADAASAGPEPDPKRMEQLEQRIAELQRRVDEVSAPRADGTGSSALTVATPSGLAPEAMRLESADPPAAEAPATPSPYKATDFTVYGRVNVSFDVGSQGLTAAPCLAASSPCAPPQGQLRWLPDVASNLSRFGVRGYHDLAGKEWRAVFQLETQVDVAATPGSKPNGNNDTINPGNTAVVGALASRNSYVGVATPLGALKIGKNDTPYKNVTADFDFLADTPGDYNSIMGNTGGDNRTEFDARFPHAIWYESPDVQGVRVNAIWSPGQNRFDDNIGFAIGENACAGGNSGPCNDGSFGDGFGFSAEWRGFGAKLIGAYEMHRRTNRTGDAGQDTPAGTSVVGTANEYAYKFGASYAFQPTGTTIAGIYEVMRRSDAASFNERDRNGYFISALQKLTGSDELMGSWAHAGKTLGDPGVGPIDNTADMLAVGYRHWFNPRTTVIVSYAHLSNATGAHYALGPGGHGVTWDCKDGSGPSTASAGPGIGLIGNGTGCFTGTKPQAVSVGFTYDF